MAHVAVIGTGIMGTGMAHSLRRAGLTVSVWNRTASRAEAVGEGTVVVDTVQAAVRDAEFVITMLPDADSLREVISPVLGAFGEGVWLQSSTVGVSGSSQLATLAEEHGVPYVECPVSGTKKPAEDGNLIVLASGSRSGFERAHKVFNAISSATHWLGDEPNAAAAMKLVVNKWLLDLTASLGETVTLSRALNVDPVQFLAVINSGPLNAPFAQLKGKMMVDGKYEPSFPAAMAAKDAGLIAAAASNAGLDLIIGNVVLRLLEETAARNGNDDLAAIVKTFG